MLSVKLATVVMQRCYKKLKTVHSIDKAVQSLMTGLRCSLRTILLDGTSILLVDLCFLDRVCYLAVFVKDCQSCAGLAIVSVFRITTPGGELLTQVRGFIT